MTSRYPSGDIVRLKTGPKTCFFKAQPSGSCYWVLGFFGVKPVFRNVQHGRFWGFPLLEWALVDTIHIKEISKNLQMHTQV